VKSHDICLTLERFTSLICTIQDSYSSPKAWLHHKNGRQRRFDGDGLGMQSPTVVHASAPALFIKPVPFFLVVRLQKKKSTVMKFAQAISLLSSSGSIVFCAGRT
jgi:hypothetical protein